MEAHLSWTFPLDATEVAEAKMDPEVANYEDVDRKPTSAVKRVLVKEEETEEPSVPTPSKFSRNNMF